MKTNALKIAIVSAFLAFTAASCNSGSRNADQEGDTMMTDSADPEIDGTDTMNTDTSVTQTTPGGGVGEDGIGSGTDTAGTPNTPTP
ncbi:hypothetical protein [Arcticibacter tournemirensis]